MRTLFDKPIRQCTTEYFYPNKMSAKTFSEKILNSAGGFVKNLEGSEDQYVEQWVETFLAWSEIENE